MSSSSQCWRRSGLTAEQRDTRRKQRDSSSNNGASSLQQPLFCTTTRTSHRHFRAENRIEHWVTSVAKLPEETSSMVDRVAEPQSWERYL